MKKMIEFSKNIQNVIKIVEIFSKLFCKSRKILQIVIKLAQILVKLHKNIEIA